MVLKREKRGISSGNTIRRLAGAFSSKEYQRYGCLIVTQEVVEDESSIANRILERLDEALSTTGHLTCQFSLNKNRRWSLPDIISSCISCGVGFTDIHITLIDHTLTPDVITTLSQTDTDTELVHEDITSQYASNGVCNQYQSTTNGGQSISSHKPMNIKSLRRGKQNEDHISKAEKRRRKHEARYKPNISLKEEPKLCSATYESTELQTYECHVWYPDQSNRRHFRKLVKVSPSKRQKVSRCHHKHSYSCLATDFQSDCVYTAAMFDRYFKTEVKKTRALPSIRQFSRCSPPVSTKPFIASHTEIFLEADILEESSLTSDKLSQSFCTPKVFAIDLSGDLGLHMDEFYLVLVLRAEDTNMNKYRAFCTGSRISDEDSTNIPTLVCNDKYDLKTLKDSAIRHGHDMMLENRYRPVTLADMITDKKFLEYINSEFDVKDADNNSESGSRSHLVTPTHFQRALSCNLQCGMCFEEFNDLVLHSAILPCQHYFCNDCWSAYLTTNVRKGKVHINCPEYGCTREVDSLFILSLTDFSTYSLYQHYLSEYSTSSQQFPGRHQCPNNVCRLSHHIKDDVVAVKYYSGTECCFCCRNESHWPLTCTQLFSYYEKLHQNGLARLVTVKESFLSNEELYAGLPNTTNSYYNIACRHRLYKSPYLKAKLTETCSKLLSRMKLSRDLKTYAEEQTVLRCLHQVVSLIEEAHNLLEFCTVLNSVTNGNAYAVPSIALLSYQVSCLESELIARTLNSIKNSYKNVKKQQEQLIQEISYVISNQKVGRDGI